MRGYMIHRL